MTKFGMVVDVTKCNGCYNCFLACKDEFCGNDFPLTLPSAMTGHFWMKMVEKERGNTQGQGSLYRYPCLHCENATVLS